MASSGEITIIEQIATINQHGNKSLELNIVSYGDTRNKYDLRLWKTDEYGNHLPAAGISMSVWDMRNLKMQLEQMDI